MSNTTTVKICGVPYTITRETDKFRVDHSDDGASVWGEISYPKHSIRILASSPEQELRTTLHEILHGIIENGGVRELIDNKGTHMENPIDQLANGLAEALESLGFELNLAGRKRSSKPK